MASSFVGAVSISTTRSRSLVMSMALTAMEPRHKKVRKFMAKPYQSDVERKGGLGAIQFLTDPNLMKVVAFEGVWECKM